MNHQLAGVRRLRDICTMPNRKPLSDGRPPKPPMTPSMKAIPEAADEEFELEPGESLQEAEDELGIADWIDPDTGDPAEGQSHPHIGD